MKIEGKCVVSIHYKLTNGDGEEVDSSAGREPLVYLHGAGGLIPGLERALEGKAANDQIQVVVQPEDGYGVVNPDLVQTVPRSAFKGIDDVQPGMQFETKDPEGQVQHIMVQEVKEDGVTVDGNHPLAGQVLHFDVTVASVRKATEEELTHGHAH